MDAAHSAAVRLTGGAQSQVACAHEHLCHHCGYLGGGEVVRCTDCGVAAHPLCVTFVDGKCDACRFGLAPDDVCAVCEVPDDPAPAHDVDRLIRTVVYHGRTWRPSADVCGRVALPDDALPDAPDAVFGPEARVPAPAHVRVGGTTYVSRPLVVHSWCATCAFQCHPLPAPTCADDARVAPGWTPLLQGLASARGCEYGEACAASKNAVLNPTGGCVFCGGKRGFQTFCYGHLNARHGCTNCRWPARPALTFASFHPSCAVRAGMYRVADTNSGMLCWHAMRHFLPKVHHCTDRTRHSRKHTTEKWLLHCSGVHIELAERNEPLLQCVEVRAPLKMVLYAAVPPHRARAQRKRRAAAVDDDVHVRLRALEEAVERLTAQVRGTAERGSGVE